MPERDPDSDLSCFLNAVRDVAGEAGVAKVVASKGGLRVSVPSTIPSHEHWLVEALGFPLATAVVAKLCTLNEQGQARGLAGIDIPLRDHGSLKRFQSARRAEAARQLQDGVGVASIARTLGISQRTLFRMKKELGIGQAAS